MKSDCCRSVHDSLRLKLHISVQQPLVIHDVYSVTIAKSRNPRFKTDAIIYSIT